MKTTLFGALLLAGALAAQNVPDVSKADAKHYKVLFENDQMRVVLASYGAGEKSEMLDHADALSIALSNRKERVTRGGSTQEVTTKVGEFEPTGGKFAEENTGSPFQTLLVEFKTREAAMAAGSSLQNLSKGRPASNEASAVAFMRTLNTASITYASTYNKGFSDGLNRMGTAPGGGKPDENRADLLAPWLAGLSEGGTNFVVTRNGYRITYTPGPGEFGKIATYTISAQPVEYGVSGTRSFFTDQSAVIRATSENRAATVKDSPL